MKWADYIVFCGRRYLSYKKLNDKTYIYSQDVKSQSQNVLLFQHVVWRSITINLMPCDNHNIKTTYWCYRTRQTLAIQKVCGDQGGGGSVAQN